MKKWQLIKYAYDNYPKGTIFNTNNERGLVPVISSGRLNFRNHFFDQIMDEENNYLIYDGEKWATIVNEEPNKIAVKVDNEHEFNALMKHYDNLGWKWFEGSRPLDKQINRLTYVSYNDKFEAYATQQERFETITFQDFAKNHGIKMPLLVSEDGVELFEGDDFYWTAKVNGEFPNPLKSILKSDKFCSEMIVFSTKQAALDWIEKQNKPKSVTVKLFHPNVFAEVSKEEVKFNWSNDGTHMVHKLQVSDIEAISNALKQLG